MLDLGAGVVRPFTLAVGLLWLLSSAPPTAHADIIRCSFTEPYVTTTYSTNTRELEVKYDIEPSKNRTLREISLQIMGPGLFELWNAKRGVVQRLELSGEGTDGMSDYVYPYRVHWLPENLHGGCISNHQKRRDAGIAPP